MNTVVTCDTYTYVPNGRFRYLLVDHNLCDAEHRELAGGISWESRAAAFAEMRWSLDDYDHAGLGPGWLELESSLARATWLMPHSSRVQRTSCGVSVLSSDLRA